MLTALYLALASLYIFAFAIDKKRESDASGDADTAEQVLLTFLFEFLVNVIITAPVVIYTERILSPRPPSPSSAASSSTMKAPTRTKPATPRPPCRNHRGWEPVMDGPDPGACVLGVTSAPRTWEALM